MNKSPYRAILSYYWNAKTKYSLHSPFVFDFFNTVMAPNDESDHIRQIENERNRLHNDSSKIDFIEFGAGSKSKNGSKRIINEVAKSSLSGKWQCRIIYNLIKRYQLKNILEIGTSLGISTAYMAKASDQVKLTTLEGNPSSADIAKAVFHKLDIDNIDLIVGEFFQTLPHIMKAIPSIDCAFIDGNHRKDATIEYYHTIRQNCSSHSVIIIDDIYWSVGMNEAWQTIIAHDSVAFSIDLFRMGIVFFDTSIMPKQHFQLIQSKWKPWSIGLFG